MSPDTWPALIGAIWDLGGRPRIRSTRERISDVSSIRRWIVKKSMLALSFSSPDGSAEVDLLVVQSQRVGELLERAKTVHLHGRDYRVAAIDDLMEMKRAAGRPQDLLDIEVLEQIKTRGQIIP